MIGRGVGERVRAQPALEAELDKLLSIRGEYRFNQLRDLHQALKRCNAFEEDLRNYRLVFP